MSLTEEVIEATLEADGTLRLSHPPRVTPGPIRVTIRTIPTPPARRGLADVLREIMADQRSRGYSGRSAEDLRAAAEEQAADEEEQDRELAAARRPLGPGGRRCSTTWTRWSSSTRSRGTPPTNSGR